MQQKLSNDVRKTTQRFNRLNVKELNITIGNTRLDQVTTENIIGIKIDQF